jgi:hypothetical protein
MLAPKINYVIATWSGERRGSSEDHIYFKKQIDSLLKLKNSITQITICVAENPSEPKPFTKYLNSLQDLPLPIFIYRRPNIGLSYGAYSDTYNKFKDSFDYYLFIEDDYFFIEDNFDQTLINMFNKEKNCGYVCGYISRAYGKEWMGNSVGLTSSKVLATIYKKYGMLPHDKSCQGNSYTEESGQVSFSDGFVNSNFSLRDITDKYKILHYYWQHKQVRPIPNQKSLDKNCLFLPYEANE